MNDTTPDHPALPDIHPERPRHAGSAFINAASLLTPAFVESTDLAEHVPFVSWLVDAVRPRVVVEIGPPDPTLFFAICQSLSGQRVQSSCHLLGFGHCREKPSRFDAWLSHLNSHYPHFAEMAVQMPEPLLGRFEDGAIDLLVLHASSQDLWGTQVNHLRKKLNQRGIILLHGCTELGTPSEPGPFGVPGAFFSHGGGLAVFPAGSGTPALLDYLFRQNPAQIRCLFARLGQGCSGMFEQRVLSSTRAQLAEASSQLASARRQVDILTGTQGALENKLEELHNRLASSNGDLEQLTCRLTDAHDEIGRSAAIRVSLESALQDLRTRLGWHQVQAIERSAAMSNLEDEVARLQRLADKLSNANKLSEVEIRESQSKLKEAQKRTRITRATLVATEEEHKATARELERTHLKRTHVEALYRKERRAKQRMKAELDSVLRSRSWRATQPLRAIVGRIRALHSRLKTDDKR